jgi:flagellar basal-body rod modification protein FlgD
MQLLGMPAIRHTLAHDTSSTGASSSDPANSATSSATTEANSLTSESTFLQLLVAQIQNQDPLNPTDSIQFVGQLVQYSELQQLVGINQGVATLSGTTASTTPSARPAINPTNGTSSS